MLTAISMSAVATNGVVPGNCSLCVYSYVVVFPLDCAGESIVCVHLNSVMHITFIQRSVTLPGRKSRKRNPEKKKNAVKVISST